MEANVACDDCCELPACVGSVMDMDETVAGLVYSASQGQVTVMDVMMVYQHYLVY